MLEIALWVAAGYVACILFPMPGVSQFVLDKWTALGVWIKSKT